MKVRIRWGNYNYGVSEYRVYRSTSTMNPASLPPPLATVPLGTNLYDDTTVVDGTTYYYIVSVVVGTQEILSSEFSILADESSLAQIPTDYYARFLMEEASGSGTLIDETTNHSGTYTSLTSVAGVVGNGFRYSGSGKADINGAITMDPSTFALSCWCKIDSVTSGSFFMLAHRDDSQALIQLSLQNGKVVLQLRSSSSSLITKNTVDAPIGTWFHLVLNFTDNGTTEVWLNNSLIYSHTQDFASSNFSSSISLIGPYNAGSSDVHGTQSADFDLYTIYQGRKLTSTEITELYNEAA